MKQLYYDEWKTKRVNKIINIFGKNWFRGKSILELGAAHGDVGIEFLKLGADVTFTDARMDRLESIYYKLKECGFFEPKLALINQDNVYDFETKFDLVIHMGVLYHVENWKKDLECALSHTNTMILETSVYSQDGIIEVDQNGPYEGISNKRITFTQESVENELKKHNCNFLRLDDRELNCFGYSYGRDIIDFEYDWENISHLKYNTLYRRMWLVIK